MKKTFEDLGYWLLDEQKEQVKIIRQILHIVNNAQCKIILTVLNRNDKMTCHQIQESGERNIDKTRVYQCLVKLEKLNFVNTVRKNNLIHYSLIKKEIVAFIDCINSNLNSFKIINVGSSTDILELDYTERGAILNYNTVRQLEKSLNCMLSTNHNKLLQRLIKMFYLNDNGRGFSEPITSCDDKALVTDGHKQFTVSRNLKSLAQCGFITRTKEKNFNHNSLNFDYFQKVTGFLTDTTDKNFDGKINPRRLTHPDFSKLRKFKFFNSKLP